MRAISITTLDQMDWSIRGPWVARGAIVYTMSDLFDTPNGMPPEPTEEDYAENSEHGFDYDGWLEYHPLRRLRADLTLQQANRAESSQCWRWREWDRCSRR